MDYSMDITRCCRKDNFNVEEGRICSIHFAADCFDHDLKNELLGLPICRILKDDSFPTKCLSYKSPSVKSPSRAVRAKNVMRGLLLLTC